MPRGVSCDEVIPFDSVTGRDDANDVRPGIGQPVVGLLGDVRIRVGTQFSGVPGLRARTLLALLAMTPGKFVSVSTIIDELWPDGGPESPKSAVQTQVSRLRSVAPMIETGPAGYRLSLDPNDVDLWRAQLLAASASSLEPAEALDTVADAVALWRGDPGGDLGDSTVAADVAKAAADIRDTLDSIAVAASSDVGDHASAIEIARRRWHRDRADETAASSMMSALHAAGRTADAIAVFAELRELLADRWGIDPSPVVAALHADLLGATVPVEPVALSGYPVVGVRHASTELVGRTDDIAAVESLLSRARLVTVTGPGGSGKTRLAHEIGRRATQRVPVVVVELAPLRSGDDVVAAISGTLGLNEADVVMGSLPIGPVHSARDRLRDTLTSRPLLMILDNCEHVSTDVAGVVDELIAASDLVRILTTSRTPLGVAAESIYPLPPLNVDAGGSPATDLFIARARAVRPTVVIDPDRIARLCTRLDGLPLAIELAAARARSMSIEEIDNALADRFSLLRSKDRTRPERHRTLHAVIDWSWQLLDDGQRRALRRLCRFPAGFTSHAARAVAEFEPGDRIDDAVDGLVEHSLLTVDESDGLRFHMLETVREFGEEHLARDPAERDAVTDSMVAWASSVALQALELHRNGNRNAVVPAIDAEHDNLLAVLRVAAVEQRWSDVFTIFPALAYLWSVRGAHSEVVNWSVRLLGATDVDPRGVPDDIVVFAYVFMASHLGYGGSPRQAARARTALRRVLRARPGTSPALRFPAVLLLHRADGKGLARVLAEAVRSADPEIRGTALMLRGSLRENRGDLYGAERDLRAAASISHDSDDLWGMAQAAQSLGSIHGQTGRHEQAAEFYLHGAQLLWRLHAYEESVQTRTFAAASLVAADRVGDGLALLSEFGHGDRITTGLAVVASDEAMRHQTRATVLGARAEAMLRGGDVSTGLALYRDAAEQCRSGWDDIGDPYAVMLACACVDAHVLHGDHDRVEDLVRWIRTRVCAPRSALARGDLPQLGAVACAVGSYLIARGRSPEGPILLAAATSVAARQDFPSMTIDLHLGLARGVLGIDAVETALLRRPRTRAAAAESILAALTDQALRM